MAVRARWVGRATVAAALALMSACGSGVQAEQSTADAPGSPATAATPDPGRGGDGEPGTGNGPGALGGKGGRGGDATGPAEPGPHPSDLVGLWRLTGDGIAKGTTVRLDDWELLIFGRPCLFRIGAWEARATGEFLADVHARHESCLDVGAEDPEWVQQAVAYRAKGQTRELLDAEGLVVATLRPGARIKPVKDTSVERSRPPKLTREQLATLDRAPPSLPDGLTPTSAEDLSGRWIPEEETEVPRRASHLTFRDDGAWQSYADCSTGGRWLTGVGGRLLAVSGPRKLGCDSGRPGRWMDDAALAGLDGDALVLLGWDGEELGRLHRG